MDTLYKAMMKRYNDPRCAAMEFLGTRNGKIYEWMTYKEMVDTAKLFAAGAMALDLIPEINHDGVPWRFMGLQSKNRKEWNLIHVSNMFNKCTSVGLYDTLGEDAEKFIINETKMTTIACTKDIIKKLLDWKESDNKLEPEAQMLSSLKNIVVLDVINM